MAFTPVPGSAGRITALSITPLLTSPAVTFAGAMVVLAEITGYRVTQSMVGEAPEVFTFESSANTEGLLGSTAIRGGIENWSVDMEGIIDIGTPNTSARFTIGMFVRFCLYAFKSTPVGWANLPGRIERFNFGQQVREGQMKFTATVKGFGNFPAMATIVP